MLRILKNHAPGGRKEYQFLTPIESHTALFLSAKFPQACRFNLDPTLTEVNVYDFLTREYYASGRELGQLVEPSEMTLG